MSDTSSSKKADLYVLAVEKAQESSRYRGQTMTSGLVNELYQRYWQELCRYTATTFKLSASDAEDVVQDTFARFAALDNTDDIENPRAFLYRVAHNTAIHHLKRAATRVRHVQSVQQSSMQYHNLSQEGADECHGERVLLAEERFEILNRVIRRLPRRKRQVLVFHRIHNLSYAEISRRTGISQTQVKRLVAQALAECKKVLERADRENLVYRKGVNKGNVYGGSGGPNSGNDR